MPTPPQVEADRVGRSSRADFVASKVAEWIASGDMKPAERLPSEPMLMARFAVSRNVVREGISKLKALGVVEVYQGKGAFVATLPLDVLLLRVRRLLRNEDLIAEIWDVRETLEGRIVELCVERATEADLWAIEQTLDALDRALERGELGVAEDQAFHRALARGAHNLIFEQLMSEVVEMMEPLLEKLLSAREDRPKRSNLEHRTILQAIGARDVGAARGAMANHLINGRRMFSPNQAEGTKALQR